MPRYTVAQPEAVEELSGKFAVSAKRNADWKRLVRAFERAHTRYAEVASPDTRGFYHGLLTGYAVALKALQGKLISRNRPR